MEAGIMEKNADGEDIRTANLTPGNETGNGKVDRGRAHPRLPTHAPPSEARHLAPGHPGRRRHPGQSST
jgi:hypothetical protein